MTHKILIVDNEPNHLDLLGNCLDEAGFEISIINSGETALKQVVSIKPTLILLSVIMPGRDGFETCHRLKQNQVTQKTPIIFLVDKMVSIDKVKGFQIGAVDYISKPFQVAEVVACITKHLTISNLHKQLEVKNAQKQIFQKSEKRLFREHYHSFIGASEPMQTLYLTIDKVATSKASILITGESGTGKELCAEAIYKESHRADKVFIVCNCAAIPEKLMESYLFGHVKGAFTGADSCRKGLVSQADGGTLFLDEIGELPLSMQSTLLRFVQTQTFSKVGSHKLEQVDIRFIWATNRNLRAEVKSKQFREDLFYRINTIEIKLPALRDRGADILLLTNFFLHKFAKKEQKDFQRMNAEAEQQLLRYEWLGNVRQLKHLIHNLVILNEDQVITAEMVNMRMDEKAFAPAPPALAETNSLKEITSVITVNQFCAFKEMEKEIINKTIKYCNGNVTRAANLLEIGRATIFKKLKQYRNSF